MESIGTAKGFWVRSKSPVEYRSCMKEAQVGETGCKKTGWAAGYRGGGGEGGGGNVGGERLALDWRRLHIGWEQIDVGWVMDKAV